MAELPLESIAWQAEVVGTVAELRVEQRFRNPTDQPIDGSYALSLPVGATLDQVRVAVDGRDQPVAPVRDGTWRLELREVGPGETVEVVVELVEPVTRRDGAWELRLPLHERPRLVAASPARLVPPELAPEGPLPVALDLRVHAASTLQRAEIPAYALDLSIEETALRAASSLEASEPLVLRWWTATDAPQAGLLVQGEHAQLVLEAPAQGPAGGPPRELIWVVDAGSARALAVAKDAMRRSLAELDPADRFAILTTARPRGGAWPGLHPASPANLRRAERRIDRMRVEPGQAAVPALLHALYHRPDPQVLRQICLFSPDYDSTRLNEVVAELGLRPEVAITSVRVGGAGDARDVLVGHSGGAVVRVAIDEPAEAAGARMAEAMDQPLITALAVDWGAWVLDESWPPVPPDLREGETSVVLARLRGGSGPVTVTGRSADGSFTQVIQPTILDEGRGLEALASSAERARREALAGRDDPADAIMVRSKRRLGRPKWRALRPAPPPLRAMEPSELRPPTPTAPRSDLRGPILLDPQRIGEPMANEVLLRVAPSGAAGAQGGLGALGGTVAVDHALDGPGGGVVGEATARLFSSSNLNILDEEEAIRLELRPGAAVDLMAAARATRLRLDAEPASRAASGAITARSPEGRNLAHGLWTSAAAGSVMDDQRLAVEAGGDLQARLGPQGSRRPSVAARAMGLRWEAAPAEAPGEGRATLATVGLGFDWYDEDFRLSPRVDLGLLRAELDGDQRAPALLPAPALQATRILNHRRQTELTLDGAWTWDTDALRLGALDADGRPGRTGQVSLTASSTGLWIFEASLRVEAETRRGPLLPPSELATVTDAALAPWFDREALAGVARLAAGWGTGEASLRWRHARAPWDEAPMLDDPAAAWTPGYLDPWRADTVQAELSLRSDAREVERLTRLGASWASGIEPDSPRWWLQDQRALTAASRAQWRIQGGQMGLELGASWSLRDPSLAMLPPLVLVQEAGGQTLGDQPQWQLSARIEVDL